MGPTFQTRFQEAARYAGVEFSPTAIGRSLGVSKQTAQYWMTTGEPKAAMIFRIADSWNVDARWLATGQGSITPPPGGPGLSVEEVEILRRYRRAEPRTRAAILSVAKTLGKAAAIVGFVVGSAAFDITKTAVASSRPQSAINTHSRAFRRLFRRALLWLTSRSESISDAAIA